MTATLQPGLRGPEAEALLAARGLTLGHYPQSEHASIGGFAATRSSGQSSAGYGRFDAMVVGLTVATPTGSLDLGSAPASAAGPDLRQLVLGSEGAFGVITSVTVRVRRAPQRRRTTGGGGRPSPRGRRHAHPRPGRAAAHGAARSRTRPRPRWNLADPVLHRQYRRPRLPDDHRLRGHRRSRSRTGGPRWVPCSRASAAPPWGRGRAEVAARPLRRALPARLAARPRRPGRDARDGHLLVRARAALRRRTRRPAGRARRGHPRCSATSRTSTRPAARSTSPSPRARATTPSPSGSGRRPRPATRSSRRAATITHHHAVGTDHRPWLAQRDRRGRRAGAAGGQGRARPGRHPQPGRPHPLTRDVRRRTRPAARSARSPARRDPARR